MKELGEKIKMLRLSKKMTQRDLSKYLNLTSDSTVSQWERGVNSPYGKDLIKLTQLFEVSSDYLLGLDQESEEVESITYDYFPTAISAGLPLEVDGMTEAEKITISSNVLGKHMHDRTIFFARISGDSMDKIMYDGMLIAIKPVPLESLKNGDIVVFSCNHEYSVKHIYKTDNAIIFKPNSTNPAHHEQHFTYEDELKIHGKVVASLRVFD